MTRKKAKSKQEDYVAYEILGAEASPTRRNAAATGERPISTRISRIV
jgi:hypothetical protein